LKGLLALTFFSGPCEPIKLQSKFVIQLGGVRPSIFAKISLQATSRFLLNFDVQKNKWSVFSPFWGVCVLPKSFLQLQRQSRLKSKYTHRHS